MRVLYDGWALCYHPAGAAALHLLALLSALAPDVEPVVALPGPAAASLPDRAALLTRPVEDTPAGRLAWEQRLLPDLARQSGAAVLHVFGGAPILPGRLPVVASPAETLDRTPGAGLAGRIRAALSYGAAVGLSALLWPSDLPHPPGQRVKVLPPLAHPAFTRPAPRSDNLPEQYILLPGSNDWRILEQALGGWVWCAGFVGEITPLLLADRAPTLLDPRSEMEPYVRSVVASTPEEWAALYQSARAVVCLGQVAPWGGPLLNALAAGTTVISVEDPLTAARVGPAGYLVPRWDSRALGAAMATLAVEEDMSVQLRNLACERARGWSSRSFGADLAKVYAGAH